jgi:hypothetical protein
LFHKSDCQQDLRPALLSAQEPLEGCVARLTWRKCIARRAARSDSAGTLSRACTPALIREYAACALSVPPRIFSLRL